MSNLLFCRFGRWIADVSAIASSGRFKDYAALMMVFIPFYLVCLKLWDGALYHMRFIIGACTSLAVEFTFFRALLLVRLLQYVPNG